MPDYASAYMIWIQLRNVLYYKFLDAGIQDVSMSISIVHDLIERYRDDGDESDSIYKHEIVDTRA